VIRGAFARRRKTLPNSLAGEFGDLSSDSLSSDNLSARAPGLAPTLTSTLTPALADIIKSAGINPAVRGETLSIDEFIALAKAIEAFL
jgi:16S rRNA A1518/A1519 N6-dimethyltransferase RsmA/KsgA/DIM1 with predicted DNA glycosylase/AP lyase activity